MRARRAILVVGALLEASIGGCQRSGLQLPPLPCAEGQGDCDGDSGNGCETDTSTSPAHCGACGNACEAPGRHRQVACELGRCVATCDAGHANCDGDPADGCEVDLARDPVHCGGCGTACRAPARYCQAGACVAELPSCLAYRDAGEQGDGTYRIRPGTDAAVEVYCQMTMDGGGWTLALSRAVDLSHVGDKGGSLTWDCLASTAPPRSPTEASDTVLPWSLFHALAPRDMLLMAGRRVLRFYFQRQDIELGLGYRALTEGSCFVPQAYLPLIGAPSTAFGMRSGQEAGSCSRWTPRDDACVTTDYSAWKARSAAACFHDVNADAAGCPGRCGIWGSCSYQLETSTHPEPTPRCWFWGGTNAAQVPALSDCPAASRAPWADYTTGTLDGHYNLWVR